MKILVFAKGSENPYQELLYTPMRIRGVDVNYLTPLTPSATVNLPTWIPQLIYYRLRGYGVFHIHWATALSLTAFPWCTWVGKRLVYWHYLLFLKTVKLLGYKLVWTAHNVLPHEPVFFDDVVARQYLVSLADLVIAHSATTFDKLKQLAIVPKRTAVIPIGSYNGIYPDNISRERSREKLGLKDGEFTYLFLGLIRKYKGVDILLHTFNRLKQKNCKLIIAGSCPEQGLRDTLRDQASSPNVLWHEGHIPDDELQIYFAAADVVVLPFRVISTSSSALLAFAFDKTVVIPAIGDLADLPDTIAYKYNPNEAGALEKKMIEAGDDPILLHQKSHAAKAYAESFSWQNIAEQTHVAMQKLFD